MNYRKEILRIRSRFLKGEISYDEAFEQVAPLLAEMNQKAALIAKEHNQKFKPLTFGYIFR